MLVYLLHKLAEDACQLPGRAHAVGALVHVVGEVALII